MKNIFHFIKNFWNRSIQRQLMLGIALVHAILMTVFVSDLVSRQKIFLSKQSGEQTEALARSLAANSVSWVLSDDVIGLEEVVQSQKNYPNIEYAMILNLRGKVLAHTDKALVGLYVKDSVSLDLIEHEPKIKYLVNDINLLDISAPIFSAQKHIGWSRVAVSQKILHDGLRKILRDGIGYTLLAIIVGSIFAVLMARGITSGIRQLLSVTRKVEHGYTHVRVNNERIDELGHLGNSFNKMIDSIKKSHSELHASEKKYRGLSESLPQGVFEIDLTGKIIYTNQNGLNLFKYTQDDLDKGLNFMQIISPDDHDRIIKKMDMMLKGGKPSGGEYTVVRRDGTTFPAMIHSNIVNRNEKPIGIRGILIDISQQRKMEADLKRRALAIDYSSDTIVITDTDGLIIYVNPAFEKITGYSLKEALGKNPHVLKSGKHDQSFYKNLWETISNGYTWSGRFINKKKDGSYYTEDATISPVFSNSGEIINYVAVKRDVSNKLRLEDQLKQSQRMEAIGTLAGGIAHDFNNILFPIIGHAEMLIEDTPKDSPMRNSLNGIYAGAVRASELVKQILTFSSQKSGELKLMKIQPLIKEVLKLIRSTIPTSIEIQQDINPNCGVIKADPTQIHQIIMNLATNAYHAMEETGGELKISLKEIELSEHELINSNMISGPYGCLTIADTGIGMDKHLIDKIFNPFFTTKERGKGTGMGLSVIHGIVKSLNGSVKVYSEPGKGTQFHVYLPIEKNFSIEQVTDSKTEFRMGTEQILLVDDEEAILTMEKQMLERIGYNVTSRVSSIEALKAFQANPDKFDLVITDMAMPNMTGAQLSSQLTEIRPDIPILLCTGFSETMSNEKAASLGINDFLLKPVGMKELSHKVGEVLSKNKKLKL